MTGTGFAQTGRIKQKNRGVEENKGGVCPSSGPQKKLIRKKCLIVPLECVQ